MIKARDIRTILQEKGAEKGIIYLFETFAEQDRDLERQLKSMAEMLDQMTDIITSITAVGENMKATIERINGQAEDGLDINTQDLGRSDG
jgi:hypothetical protein